MKSPRNAGPARQPHLLLLHKYGSLAASFRHRLQQYVPYLEEAGFRCTVAPLLGDDYLRTRFRTGRRSLVSASRGMLRRLQLLADARRYDLAIVSVELFPYVPHFFERLLLADRLPYIYDFDDAIFHTYDLSPSPVVRMLLGSKIRHVAAGAAAIFAGNRYLADYVKPVNPRVDIMPTVVDLRRYMAVKDFRAATRPFSIGWIGSPSTARYLEMIGPALKDFCRNRQARVVVVGAGTISLPGCPVERRAWTEGSEVRDILDFDVGLMPLTDDPWSRGKSGFKLIQYMACGLPVIASPVGVNRELVEHGVNGFLAEIPSDWVAALTRLYEDRPTLWAMGAAGRRTVEARYCLQVMAPRFLEVVGESMARPKAIDARRRSQVP